VPEGSVPRVAVVAYDVYGEAGAERVVLETVRRTQGRVDWVAVADRVAPEARGLMAWRRAPAAPRPFALRLASFAASASARLAQGGVDLVHATGPLLPRRVDLVTVHFLRAAFYESIGAGSALGTRAHLALERRFLGSARMLAAVSEAGRRELERRFPGRPVVLVPNGVDASRFGPSAAARTRVRTELGVPEDRPVALFVGNAWTRKGLPLAIEALGRLDAELWVVGLGDPARYQPAARAAGSSVRFLGVRTDVEQVYAAADVLVLPSAYETFLLTAFEAGASGLPVVATAVGGVEELVGDGEAGAIVARDPDAVATGLRPFLADPELRRRAGAVARERASAFTWERSVEALLSAYDELLR
jgi:glycosyltransferase involved in cell wall biosynthesis